MIPLRAALRPHIFWIPLDDVDFSEKAQTRKISLTEGPVLFADGKPFAGDAANQGKVTIPFALLSPNSEDVTMPTERTMAGGWNEGAIDQTTEEAVAFVLSRMNTSGKLKRIVRVKKQVVKGMNYDIIFELDNNTVWNAVVYRGLSGEFSITRASKVE